MTFSGDAVAYNRFMGRYSIPLASTFADFAGVAPGQRLLDVGSGPGALTDELVRRLGSDAVTAVDPSEGFIATIRERHPTLAAHVGRAESLPFEDDRFDASLAQLVVHFMKDPVGGLREMSRVTRPGGVVAACVWDHAGEAGPLAAFWDAARELDPNVPDEGRVAGAREGHLASLFTDAGLNDVEQGVLSVSVEHPTFEDWWEPFLLGVGPAGDHVASLDAAGRTRLADRCRRNLPPAPFVLHARAWVARGHA